jgi:hypothetical protein
MVSKWAEIQIIDGVRTVTNVVLASKEIAKERGYEPVDDREIGFIEKGGKFIRPEKPAEKLNALRFLASLNESEAEALVSFLSTQGVVSPARATSLKSKKE